MPACANVRSEGARAFVLACSVDRLRSSFHGISVEVGINLGGAESWLSTKPCPDGSSAMDRPRFQRVEGKRDELHRRYHGGGVVEAVFRLVDAWQRRRPQPGRRSPAPIGKFRRPPFASELTTVNARRDGPA